MKSFQKLSSVLLTLTALTIAIHPVSAEEAHDKVPMMPNPTPEHTWLKQFVGEWETQGELNTEPGKPATHVSGVDKVRPVGEFWVVSETKSQFMDKPFTGNMTIGYNADKKKYVGTWVDSMNGQLWEYEGQVDPAGKTLTMEAEGTCPMHPGKTMKFREVTEFKDKDHKVTTTSVQDDSGKWTTMATMDSHRKN